MGSRSWGRLVRQTLQQVLAQDGLCGWSCLSARSAEITDEGGPPPSGAPCEVDCAPPPSVLPAEYWERRLE